MYISPSAYIMGNRRRVITLQPEDRVVEYPLNKHFHDLIRGFVREDKEDDDEGLLADRTYHIDKVCELLEGLLLLLLLLLVLYRGGGRGWAAGTVDGEQRAEQRYRGHVDRQRRRLLLRRLRRRSARRRG
jgi:hypothetical protein